MNFHNIVHERLSDDILNVMEQHHNTKIIMGERVVTSPQKIAAYSRRNSGEIFHDEGGSLHCNGKQKKSVIFFSKKIYPTKACKKTGRVSEY